MSRPSPSDRADEDRSAAVADVAALLLWYDRSQRDLPWRRSRDPYRVWVSEIMLQQTRVAAALPYYEAFVARFPGVEELAAAEVDEVLALWSGLGYYRRARQMHAAARYLAATGGSFPQTAEALRELPGIGPYTAAAIASISFGQVVPVLDGNVARVVARRLALRQDVQRAAVRRRLLAAAATWLDPQRPGDSNQALMELGATVCTPRAPRCGACPLAAGCRGRDEPERYPAPRRQREPVALRLALAVVTRRDAVLLFRRRGDHELMAGLWELPQVELTAADEAPAALAGRLARRYGGTWRLGPEVCRLRHAITHRRLDLRVHRAELDGQDECAEPRALPQAAWVTWPPRGGRHATSSMVAKVLAALAATT